MIINIITVKKITDCVILSFGKRPDLWALTDRNGRAPRGVNIMPSFIFYPFDGIRNLYLGNHSLSAYADIQKGHQGRKNLQRIEIE